MFQVDNPTAAGSRPASTAAGSPGWFTAGNAAGGVPATVLDAEYMNMLQGELLALLTAAAITPDKTNGAQLLASIEALAGTLAAGPAAGDSSLKVATTAWVANEVGGHSTVSVAGSGSVTLTPAQTGVGVLLLNGALTGNRTVVLPTTGRWLVVNGTSGAYNLTCQTAAGSGYIVRQGFGYRLYGDGTNIMPEGEQAFSGTAAPPTLQVGERYEQYT